MKKIGILFLIAILLISHVSSDPIIISNQTTDHTIQWSWTNSSLTTALTVDGYRTNNFDPLATTFILSDLSANTSHQIIIYNYANFSMQKTNTKTSVYDLAMSVFNDWFPVFIILGLFIGGFAIHWLIFFIGSGVSLYFLYDWIQRYPIQTVGIGNLHFLVYAALFILGLILWLFKRKRR